jgi:hypothetical protein
MLRSSLALLVLAVSSAVALAEEGQTIKIKKDGKGPAFGYLSGSTGAFTLDGESGHACFRWNHGLTVDWHDLELSYAGTASDDDGNEYWVYEGKIHHEEHEDMVRLLFGQKTAAADEGYRVFVSHGEDIHDWHLLALDATRLPYHK